MSNNDASAGLKLLRGATAIHGSDDNDRFAFFRGLTPNANVVNYPVSSVYLDNPNTTDATTYKIQWFTTSGTIFLNRRGIDEGTDSTSSITAIEIPV